MSEDHLLSVKTKRSQKTSSGCPGLFFFFFSRLKMKFLGGRDYSHQPVKAVSCVFLFVYLCVWSCSAVLVFIIVIISITAVVRIIR